MSRGSVRYARLVWPFLATGLKMERWEGFVLLAIYVGYMVFLFG